MSLDIVLKRAGNVYIPGEKVSGYVRITSRGKLSHTGLRLFAEGGVNISYSQSKKSTLWESMISNVKPIKLINMKMELEKSGKFPDGSIEKPFEFVLEETSSYPLFETYHGVYLSVRYRITVELSRGFFSKTLRKSQEFIVHNPYLIKPHLNNNPSLIPKIASASLEVNQDGSIKKIPKQIIMNPSKLKNVQRTLIKHVPDYKIIADLPSTICDIEECFKGNIRVISTESKIKSIELQLVRVESCFLPNYGSISEKTEIQNLQVAEGNICKDFVIPVFMVFPRLFSCPTVKTNEFNIEFDMNLIILFHGGHQITENIHIHLYRKKKKQKRCLNL